MENLSFNELSNELEALRVSGERAPARTVRLGKILLSHPQVSQLSDEVWTIYEQICIASLDVGDIDYAKELLLKIGAKFPDSSRFKILLGMSLEAQSQFDEAQNVYNDIISKDESYLPALKRKITILKAKGLQGYCSEALVEYLKINPVDAEAWVELSNLYLASHKNQVNKIKNFIILPKSVYNELFGWVKYLTGLDQAAHCVEELLLIEPTNHIYYLKYADIVFSLGHIALAFKHYCKVVEQCPDNPRAFLSIKLCAHKLLNGSEPVDRSLVQQVDKIAVKVTLGTYSKLNKETLHLIEKLLIKLA